MTMTTAARLEKIPVSPEPLYRLLFGRPMTQILYAAYDFGLFELLSKAPQTQDDICARLDLPAHSAQMLIHTCAAIGLLKKEGDVFHNTALSENYLVHKKPFHLGGLLEHFRKHVYPAWDHLQEAVREDGPQMKDASTTQKADIFQVTKGIDIDTELFIAAMHNLSVSDGLLLAEAFDFSRFSHLIDVGGGSGALSLAVASRFPHLRATVFDRPQVCALSERYIQEAGLETRVRTVGGDAFRDALPSGADILLMSLFVHAFGLKQSTPLLKRCFEALPPGGCLLIYEPVLDSSRTGPLTTLLSSLNMLVVTPSGGDVTAEEYRLWLQDNGFKDVFYKPIPAIRHLIGGYKPVV